MMMVPPCWKKSLGLCDYLELCIPWQDELYNAAFGQAASERARSSRPGIVT
jgi:hypothetical protein